MWRFGHLSGALARRWGLLDLITIGWSAAARRKSEGGRAGAPGALKENGLYQFDPAGTFSACEAATSGDVADSFLSDHKKIITKLQVTCCHATAPQEERVLMV